MAFDRKVGVMDLATVLNISERRVGQLCRDGILAKDEFGTYDLPTNVQAYVKFREGVVAEASGSSVYGRARASLFDERAKLARIKRETAEGETMPTAEVIAMGTAIMSTVKTRLLAVSSAIAPRLIMLKTAREAAAVVYPAIEEALEEISKLKVLSKRERTNGKRKTE